jgi:hypothetical protein
MGMEGVFYKVRYLFFLRERDLKAKEQAYNCGNTG